MYLYGARNALLLLVVRQGLGAADLLLVLAYAEVGGSLSQARGLGWFRAIVGLRGLGVWWGRRASKLQEAVCV